MATWPVSFLKDKETPAVDELAALSKLVHAAEGRATPEPVIALGISLLSPWAGDRRDIINQPNKSAPSTPDALLRFVRDVRPQLAAPLPTDTGWLGWLRYSGLAKPLAEIERCPAWLRSPDLRDGWLALPPSGGLDVLSSDGRISALHVLCSQIRPSVPPLDAALCLLGWFLGNSAAEWSRVMADQCPQMTFPAVRYRDWHRSFRNASPARLLPVITGSPVAADWTRPLPTPAELQAAHDAELRREATRLNREAWHKPRVRA
jgi:hypothetical protein